MNIGNVGVTAQGQGSPDPSKPQSPAIPPYIEQGFRWLRETVALIYAHHQHPLPMVALIFMYAETLGKPLAVEQGKGPNPSTKDKVCAFIEKYLPKLWNAVPSSLNKADVLGNYYRNGLVHQMFMKQNVGIHEDRSGNTSYISTGFPGIPVSINIDRLVPEFLDGLAAYYTRLLTDNTFLSLFETELSR